MTIGSLKTKVRRALSEAELEVRFAGLALRGTPVRRGDVALDSLLIGDQCGTRLETWVASTGEWSRASCRLRDSPYVHFLRAVQDSEASIADDYFLEEQPYYQMAQTAVHYSGSYFGARTGTAIKRQMRAFYATYASLRDGRENQTRVDDYRHSKSGASPMVSEVRASHCHEIHDGHHRAAALYVMGGRGISALILGEKETYLQMLVGSSAERALEVSQPIDVPEVSGWTVRRQCRDRLRLMWDFVRRQGWADEIRTAFDAAAGYGWFVHELRQRGLEAVGVSPVDTDVKVGRVAFRLSQIGRAHV